jgi:hypothetical protein
MQRQINYIALVAGILTLVLIAISVFVPWWQLSVGEPAMATVNVSPVNFNFSLFGNILTIPLIYALNIASLLTLAAGGIIMLAYSVYPTKSYSKQLLGFGYKKPLYAVILFVIALLGMYFSVRYLAGMDFPLNGSGTMGLPEAMANMGVNVNVSVPVSAYLGWPFYLAIVVAALCIAARFYHRKIVMPAPAAANTVVGADQTVLPPPPPPT